MHTPHLDLPAQRRWLLAIPASLALAGLATPGHAQTNWTLRATQTIPPARLDAGMAFDSLRGRTVLFGGGTGVIDLFDTWEWDGLAWTLVIPASSPPARESGRMAFDTARGVTVLFGGYVAGAANDTWEWAGTNWTQRAPAASPPPRYYHALAYDAARGETVLFGGYGGGYLGDTWIYDGTNWTQRFPANSPGSRTQVAMAYDAARQRIIAFGGRTSVTNYPSTTWEWDGVNWNLLTPAGAPPAREGHAMTYDHLRQRVVLFGGSNSSGTRLNDTWEWDGSAWQQRTPTVTPAPVRYAAMAYDSVRQRSVVFGGVTNTGVNGATWEYYHPAPATYVTFGSGCAGRAGVPLLSVAPDHLPWLGTTFRVDLSNAPPLTAAALVWGFSRTLVGPGPIPLPLNLGILGAPFCNLLVDPVLSPSIATDISGNGSVSRALPDNAALIGLMVYDQFAVFDLTANALGLVLSRAGGAMLTIK